MKEKETKWAVFLKGEGKERKTVLKGGQITIYACLYYCSSHHLFF